MDSSPDDTDTTDTDTDTETETSTDTDPLDGGNKDDAGDDIDGGNPTDDSGVIGSPDAGDSGLDGSVGPPSMKTHRK